MKSQGEILPREVSPPSKHRPARRDLLSLQTMHGIPCQGARSGDTLNGLLAGWLLPASTWAIPSSLVSPRLGLLDCLFITVSIDTSHLPADPQARLSCGMFTCLFTQFLSPARLPSFKEKRRAE